MWMKQYNIRIKVTEETINGWINVALIEMFDCIINDIAFDLDEDIEKFKVVKDAKKEAEARIREAMPTLLDDYMNSRQQEAQADLYDKFIDDIMYSENPIIDDITDDMVDKIVKSKKYQTVVTNHSISERSKNINALLKMAEGFGLSVEIK